MLIGTLTINVNVDLTQLQSQLSQIQAALNPVNKTMQQFATSTNAVNRAAAATTKSVRGLSQAQKEAEGTSANLGRTIRVWATEMFGSSVAIIALGTAIGNLATQAVAQLLIALRNSIFQFQELQNTLAQNRAVWTDFNENLRFITDEAFRTGRALTEVGQEFGTLAQQAEQAGVPLDRLRQMIREYNEQSAQFKAPSIATSFSGLLNALGEFIAGLDRMLFISTAISSIFDGLAFILRSISSLFGLIATQAERTGTDITANLRQQAQMRAVIGAQTLQEALRSADLVELAKQHNLSSDARVRLQQLQALAQERLNQLAREEEEIRRRIAALPATPEQRLQAEELRERTIRGLNQELDALTNLNRAQEVRNRLFAIQEQLRAINPSLVLQEGTEEYRRMEDAIIAVIAAQDSLARAANNLSVWESMLSGQRTLVEDLSFAWMDHATVMEETQRRIQAAMGDTIAATIRYEQIQRQSNLRFEQGVKQVAQTAASAITTIWPKQKGAAIAAATINTAVAFTEALKLPFPLNWAQSALVLAAGVAQIAAIRSTNQNGASSLPSGNNSSTSNLGQGSMPTTIVIQPVDPAGIFTGVQLNNLIENINERARNGTIVVSNQVI